MANTKTGRRVQHQAGPAEMLAQVGDKLKEHSQVASILFGAGIGAGIGGAIGGKKGAGAGMVIGGGAGYAAEKGVEAHLGGKATDLAAKKARDEQPYKDQEMVNIGEGQKNAANSNGKPTTNMPVQNTGQTVTITPKAETNLKAAAEQFKKYLRPVLPALKGGQEKVSVGPAIRGPLSKANQEKIDAGPVIRGPRSKDTTGNKPGVTLAELIYGIQNQN